MTRFPRSLPIAALVLTLALAPVALAPKTAVAQETAQAQRVQVGQTAPEFTLPDLRGTEHTLSALRGEKNVLLVFFRGAW